MGASGAKRSHRNDFRWPGSTGRNSTTLGATIGALKVLPCNRGDKAMWIVLYVAMIASFRAMGVAVAPVETDKDRGPFSDM
jgi:hypothetical protein